MLMNPALNVENFNEKQSTKVSSSVKIIYLRLYTSNDDFRIKFFSHQSKN